jgi:UPF0176 protein
MPLTAADRAHPDHREGIRCRNCAGEPSRQAAAAERQRQTQLAAARGEVHIGTDARLAATRNRAAKEARRLAAAAPAESNALFRKPQQ